jgi:argininosuccinate lyase
MKIWQKDKTQSVNESIDKYTVGDDYLLDMNFIQYDIQASKAHSKGLLKIGILNNKEYKAILKSLQTLESLIHNDSFSIKLEEEDCHTAIENYLIAELGDIGKKIHTGRSRNDQILVAIRMYMKANLKETIQLLGNLQSTLYELAIKNKDVPMPGYSHTQQAMLTSVGHYFAAFHESILNDSEFMTNVAKAIDQNPLGSAAGFGVNLALDRELTTKELGFAKVQINSLYCQNSRGKYESLYLESLSQVMMSLGKLAEDLVMFTSREFNYFTVSDEFTTGSSIMPQKRNLDVMELVRGNVSVILADQLNIKMLAKSLPSGYNRDFQLMKKPLVNSTELTQSTISIVTELLKSVKPNKNIIADAIKLDILAADIATENASNGVPFREAYKKALNGLEGIEKEVNWSVELKKKQSLGSAGNLGLPS